MEKTNFMADEHRPPFPFFGGKSRAAGLIWPRLGKVDAYVEPFFGSGAILFGNPSPTCVETVNDKDCYVANFWRSVKGDPEAVADHADYPVNECDLESRHYWLISEGAKKLRNGLSNPDFFDAKIAGWWVYGISAWIGYSWCSGRGPWIAGKEGWEKKSGEGAGISRIIPQLRNAGQGVSRKQDRARLFNYFENISARLRYTRVCCGDWSRVVAPALILGSNYKTSAVVLDPPYGEGRVEYSVGEEENLSGKVMKWALENGDNPKLRIVVCGYDGQFSVPDNWICEKWKTASGYSSISSKDTQGKKNRFRECLWFSPHCLKTNYGIFTREKKF